MGLYRPESERLERREKRRQIKKARQKAYWDELDRQKKLQHEAKMKRVTERGKAKARAHATPVDVRLRKGAKSAYKGSKIAMKEMKDISKAFVRTMDKASGKQRAPKRKQSVRRKK